MQKVCIKQIKNKKIFIRNTRTIHAQYTKNYIFTETCFFSYMTVNISATVLVYEVTSTRKRNKLLNLRVIFTLSSSPKRVLDKLSVTPHFRASSSFPTRMRNKPSGSQNVNLIKLLQCTLMIKTRNSTTKRRQILDSMVFNSSTKNSLFTGYVQNGRTL